METKKLNDNEKQIYYITKIANLETEKYKSNYNFIMSSILTAISVGVNYTIQNNISAGAVVIGFSALTYCFGKNIMDILKLGKAEEKLEELNENGKSK